ncbi:hypothetical protein H5U98_16255 [Mycolicibacterium boenickei]|uniref:O-acyltransferase WSD1-like N-terminal domain-containing protein n=1 Tax=Mycolicibacterium boenickei TaxID=146017 RepID=A0AAX2ZPN1_9MYCO|nr:wax ester/triacylglycerol synthase domain-containing protein [Mycolicibacterium boenickei]PEG58364.1 hypothetical protein CQY21_23125 [Mycolicibacterium boenickei]UNB97177.1 hypothetical protein H5U98_16255 [Mycolicibacterium boenickei]BBX92833.1 hypothetical protein MBOE_44820 [Mycolicibacterium boenickei]
MSKARSGIRRDNRLVYLDQAMFDAMRAGNRAQLMQCLWIYEHPVDVEALQRFHHHLGGTFAGRLIQRSPLPFGRHRWIHAPGTEFPMDVEAQPRTRAELSDWTDEQAARPIDPERGPGWRLAVLPMTDGSTAISLVASHCMADGVAGIVSVICASKGESLDFGYPPPRARTVRARLRAAREDAVATARDLPEVFRTIGAAARMLIRRRDELAAPAPVAESIGVTGGDRVVTVPAISVFVDVDQWDARAKSLGGNTYSLLAGFAARLGERMGRCGGADGEVNLLLALSDRGLDDTRANAMTIGNVGVDPTGVTSDLSSTRTSIRAAIRARREEPDESALFLPLIPFVPRRALTRLSDAFVGAAGLPVSCSNMGELDPAFSRADGTDAEFVVMRGVDQNVIEREIVRAGGHLVLVSGRLGGRISISVVGYQPGAENTKDWLRELATQVLGEFELTGMVI